MYHFNIMKRRLLLVNIYIYINWSKMLSFSKHNIIKKYIIQIWSTMLISIQFQFYTYVMANEEKNSRIHAAQIQKKNMKIGIILFFDILKRTHKISMLTLKFWQIILLRWRVIFCAEDIILWRPWGNCLTLPSDKYGSGHEWKWRFSSNSEANASELPENLEKMFAR